MHLHSPKMPSNPLANIPTCHQLLVLLLLSLSCYSTQVVAQQFTEAPADLNVTEGSLLSLNCTFMNADRIFWRVGGEEIAAENVFFNVSSPDGGGGGDTSTLSLRPSANHTVHTGAYECVAIRGAATFSTNFTITVQYLAGVSINFRPFRCTKGAENPYIGSPVYIDCTAEGEPFPRVAWFLGGRKLRDSDNPGITFQQNKRVLFISSLQSNQTGLYHCQSENDLFRPKQSPQITLGFRAPSQQTVTITNADPVYASVGGSVTILCAVTPSFPSTQVLFRQEGHNIQTDDRTFRITRRECNVFSLEVSNISTIRLGEYQCTIPSAGLVDTVSIRIGTVVPVEVSLSQSLIGVGRNVTFRCVGTRGRMDNDIPQTIHWQFLRQGTTGPVIRLVPMDQRLTIVEDEASITSELTLQRVILLDAGTYTCVTSNPTQLSIQANDSATLTVEASPNISVTPSTSIVRVGAPLTLSCSMSTTRNSSFLWDVNGVDVRQLDDRYSIEHTPPNRSTLRISHLNSSDLGQIRCNGTDPIHVTISAKASIMESMDLYIVGQLEGQTDHVVDERVEIQRDLVLVCAVRNADMNARSIRWFLGHRELMNGTEYSINSSGGTLTKNNISLNDEAGYLCRAVVETRTGTEPVVLELTFNVMVTIPPAFTRTPPESSQGVRGERFRLTCEASGRPSPTISWSRMSQRVSELGDPLILDPGNGSLIFEQLQRNHSGLYLCEIQGPRSMTSQTLLSVVDMDEEFMGVGNLTKDETILVFTVVGLVAILILIASVMLIAVLFSCYYMRRPQQGKYSITNKGDQLDGAFNKRQGSLRDNSGIHSSPSNHIFDTLQSPSSTTGYSSNPFSMGAANAMPLTTYGGGGALPLTVGSEEILGGGPRGMATNSMFSENINSHTSTPLHGTVASTSLFGSEEQTSVTTQLPNFPRGNLQLGEVMGEGEFGPVVMGVATGIVSSEERTLVAVKAIVPRGGGAGEEGEEELNPEMALVDFANQMKLEFANIAMILGMCTDEEPYYVIYEYLNEGDLKKFLINSRPFDDDPPSLTPQHMQKIILQVADGMAYLFSQRIIHGDLATRNCLISSDLRVKIADLGIGHDLYNNDYYDNGSQLLPIRWMPPELLVNSDEGPTFSLHSDIWSFGVLCWEVFSYSRLPYDSLTDEDVLSMVPAGTRLRIPSKSCPPALYDIMMDCWHDIPEERPVFAKLCVAIIGCELD